MDKDKVLLVLHGKQAGNEEVRAAVAAQREAGRDLAIETAKGIKGVKAVSADGLKSV
ncbi:lipid kinase YegS, partial [Pseudomonas aeruginosa]|nr:lipid kinase YegS [Pseudomonas aeruginosa]